MNSFSLLAFISFNVFLPFSRVFLYFIPLYFLFLCCLSLFLSWSLFLCVCLSVCLSVFFFFFFFSSSSSSFSSSSFSSFFFFFCSFLTSVFSVFLSFLPSGFLQFFPSVFSPTIFQASSQEGRSLREHAKHISFVV